MYNHTQPRPDRDVLGWYWYALIWLLAIVPLGLVPIVILSSILHVAWRRSSPRKAMTISRQGWRAALVHVLLLVAAPVAWYVATGTLPPIPSWAKERIQSTLNLPPNLDRAQLEAEIQEHLQKETGLRIPVSCPEKIARGSSDMCTATHAGESFSIAVDVPWHGWNSYKPIGMVTNQRLVEKVKLVLEKPTVRGRIQIDRVDCPPLVIASAGQRAVCLVFSGENVIKADLHFTDSSGFTVQVQ